MTRLRQRSDISEKLVLAFEGLISMIGTEPDHRKGTEGLMESGLLSRPKLDPEIIGSDVDSDYVESEPSFDDAVEQL